MIPEPETRGRKPTSSRFDDGGGPGVSSGRGGDALRRSSPVSEGPRTAVAEGFEVRTLLCGYRKVDPEDAPAARFALHGDGSAVRPDDAQDHRQTETPAG